jgi:hypothetical protein
MAEQRLSPSGRYLLLERRGAPESLVPLEDLPNNGRQYEREFTPASERPSRHPVITDFEVFE